MKSTYPVPSEVGLRLANELANTCVLKLEQAHRGSDCCKSIGGDRTYVTSRRNFRVGARGNIQPIVPSRLKGDGDVRVVFNGRSNKVCHVVDILLELVVDPCNRVSSDALGHV